MRIPTGKMTFKSYEKFLANYQGGIPSDKEKALMNTATRGIAHIATKAIPGAKPFPPILFGTYRRSWKILARGVDSIEIGSDVPYAGVIEYGSRPHWPPKDAMILWAKRKFGVEDAEARRIAWAVIVAISRRGTKPRYVNKGSKPVFEKILAQSVREFLS